ncbi:long-chain fatty acid--CoA ligase [Glutamicibacter halophytocola]|uniref:Long-chain fatty acid--CoA ligase n=1 Tax=Glutamicibacter halophytocola TaxID=1933880 RepID=A0ABX5Y6Q2_9MICC|nr:long-chain fatty acid--CoA ligase [Glutamicibacter halophytocola]QDY65789.1 long-chain fatty acid--CoA ligase [Glutamicibacter halophytocola]
MSRPTSNLTLSVAAILAESAVRHANRTAITLGPNSTSYAELWDETRAYAGALRDQGIGENDRVAILIPNVTDFARVYYAILSLGATVVPIHALLKAREIAFVLQDSSAKMLVCAAPLIDAGAGGAKEAGVPVLSVLAPEELGTDRLEDRAKAAEPIDTYLPRHPEDIATILYTSGTTGKPKGALGTHLALLEQTNVLLQETFEMRTGDRIFGGLPLFHTFGQTTVLNSGLRAGAEILLLPKFTGDDALNLLLEKKVQVFLGVPTMYVALLEAIRDRDERPESLRYAISGGAALPLTILTQFEERFGARIHEGYGLTETSPVVSFNHVGRDPVPGTVGTALWGVQIRIADPSVPDRIQALPNGELGEVVIRGHNLFSGYLNRPEATAEAVVEGWFRTGDLGTLDDDGYLRIVDRTKDMILRNGYNVYPREVEEALLEHPEISNAAVYGVDDPTRGQEVAAAITLAPNSTLTAEAVIDWISQRIAAYKFPRIVEVVTEFPMGPSGKILKRELAAQHQSKS